MNTARSFPGSSRPLRWSTMSTAERERAYSPSSCLPDGDYGPFVDGYLSVSDRVWADLEAAPDVVTAIVRYGDGPMQTIDVAVPASSATAPPLLVFIHGGYWQELSKLESRFAAGDCIQRGWAFAAVDYPLAPAADIATIVAACRAAVRTLHDDASSLGVDPNRVVVAGSSAGAHLAAMVALDREPPSGRLRGVVLVSGVFELEPLIGTSINDALGLDHATSERNSPLRAGLAGFPRAVIAYGDDETTEFKAQSQAFAAALDHIGTPIDCLDVPDRNHFDVILDLAAPDTALGDAVAHLIDTTGDPHAHV